MPPYKPPTLLRELALRQTADLIEDTCVNIRRRHISHIARYFEASRLRDYLVSKIRPLIDELCWYIFTRERGEWVAGEDVFWTFMTPHTKHLNLTYRWTRSVCHDVLLDKHFWGEHLRKFPNLLEFNLETINNNIPSELFGILGKYCRHLEVIKFRFIATKSIEDLKTIKSLRIIKNTKPGWYFDTRRDLLCILLQSLPNLEYIDGCSCMAEVLASMEDVSTLNLMHVCDAMPTLKGVENIVKLCTNLTSLTLSWFKIWTDDDDDDDWKDGVTRTRLTDIGLEISSLEMSEVEFSTLVNPETWLPYHFKNVVTPVTESALEISNLELRSFEFSTCIQELFQTKGKFIKSLTVQNPYDISTYNLLILIGTNCHHLEDLKLYNTGYDLVTYQHTPYHGPESIFKKLVKFTCHGNNPIPIQVCLINAQNIQSISVSAEYWTIEEGDTGDLLTAELISKNPMNELQSLCIDFSASEFVLSQYLIQYLFYTLPKLVKLELLNMVFVPELEESLQALMYHIASNNINLTFRYSFDGKPSIINV